MDQLNQINQSLSDAARIRDTMDSRRRLVEEQARCDTEKFHHCKDIAERKKADGVGRSIDELEETNPPLWEFIRYLEYMRYGTWCARCNVPMQIRCDGNAMTQVMTLDEAADYIVQHTGKIIISQSEYDTLKEKATAMSTPVSTPMSAPMNNELIERCDRLEKESEKLRCDILQLRREISGTLDESKLSKYDVYRNNDQAGISFDEIMRQKMDTMFDMPSDAPADEPSF
jgi:hypothetical protein